ncbi:ectomycorrhiza-upregulated GH16 glucan endo-1,3-beta-glucosidase precursor [Crucibulum laeve]|uniref:Ectomycorrhiza-upregulated GH16 glucan endo-1,3-beta-glucosidase n=1 Tax=Crucibulum laeve TaxID=68775 RepID=A0A5C3LUH0_9AGAR|nr:ectomycorrhiza-upregulated GH16 glucan endo-1,3-beta-glucosidase precursor [Crucibulum laeve]
MSISNSKETAPVQSSGADSRPHTASTSRTHLSDPFASPLPSRAPSVHKPNASHVSFSSFSSGIASVPRTPTNDSFQPHPILTTRTSARFAVFSTEASSLATPKKITRMRSHALPDDKPMEKPWNDKPNPRARFAYFLTYFVICLGLTGGVLQSYFTYKNVPLDRSPLCLVLDENFDNPDTVFGENGSFFREVNMDGFGNGEFEMATASQNNSFVKDGMLYIVPTLTSDSIGHDAVFDGTVFNITGCTFNETRPDNGFIMSNGQRVFDWQSYYRACSAVANSTAGTVVNPVQSARLTTKKSASIKYGRVEVRAKMPNGDWMWPAIWMLPKDEVYGPWPLSGEIDIVESRGNGIRYTAHGSNFVQGSLNWGPAQNLNGVSKSYSWWTQRRESFGSKFHTYALEWTDQFIRMYVDSRLHTLLDLRFNQPFFKRGDFPEVIFNGSSLTALQNPWINGTNATPFDQEFYLILNVAVGSTNGWFPESQGNKPWLDNAAHPVRDFAKAQNQWYPTWPSTAEDRGMVVDYVKMWKHC